MSAFGTTLPNPVSRASPSNYVHVAALITGLLSEGLAQTVLTARPDAGNRTWGQGSRRAIVPAFSSAWGLKGARSPPASEAAVCDSRKDKGLNLVRECSLHIQQPLNKPKPSGSWSLRPQASLGDNRGKIMAPPGGGQCPGGEAGSHLLLCYSHEEGKYLVLFFKGKNSPRKKRASHSWWLQEAPVPVPSTSHLGLCCLVCFFV